MEQAYLSVTALTKYLKRKFDVDPYLQTVYLTGEISNFRLRPNHQYFSLKDDGAKISAIMFSRDFAQIKFKPEEGMKVLVVGHVRLYEPTGSYQIIVEKMEPDGIGALYQAYEQLRAKLQAEGLFDQPKKSIPRFPKTIAVLTSESGAVIQDIQTTIARRYPIAQIVLLPTVVQGEQSASSIVKNLERVEQMEDIDTIIIGRGGGSIEDLWSFNEEIVVRKVATMSIPIISSVGHETDTTLVDFVADVRAATPTAAAEIATPVLTDVKKQVVELEQRVTQRVQYIVQFKRQELQKLQQSVVLKHPRRLYETYLQRFDFLQQQLASIGQLTITQFYKQYEQLHHRLRLSNQQSRIVHETQQIKQLQERLEYAAHRVLTDKTEHLHTIVGQLDVLSPLKSMLRGYSIITKQNEIIRSISQVEIEDQISIQMSDGVVQATVNEKMENE